MLPVKVVAGMFSADSITRNKIKAHNFLHIKCKTECEKERQNLRMLMQNKLYRNNLPHMLSKTNIIPDKPEYIAAR